MFSKYCYQLDNRFMNISINSFVHKDNYGNQYNKSTARMLLGKITFCKKKIKRNFYKARCNIIKLLCNQIYEREDNNGRRL